MKTILFFFTACALFAQTTFEVVSIKPSPPGATERGLSNRPGARLVATNATLRMLILLGYQVMPFQLSGGPGWLSSTGFDIEAKAADPNATPEQFRQMVQRLLADRFQFRCHMATREMPVYVLEVAKKGGKLVGADDDDSKPAGVRIEGRGHISGIKATMTMLATTLTRVLQREVVDRTGLSGVYAFTLNFTPGALPPGAGSAAPPESDAPTIFTAIQEQLGLTLKAAKGPVEMLIVDRAELPASN